MAKSYPIQPRHLEAMAETFVTLAATVIHQGSILPKDDQRNEVIASALYNFYCKWATETVHHDGHCNPRLRTQVWKHHSRCASIMRDQLGVEMSAYFPPARLNNLLSDVFVALQQNQIDLT